MNVLRQAKWLKNGHYATDKEGEIYYRYDEFDKDAIKLDKTKYSWGKMGPIRADNYYYGVQIGKTKKAVHSIIARNYPEICGKWFEGAIVHHKNGLKYDNRAENLQVLSPEEHTRWHTQTKIEFEGKIYAGLTIATRETGVPYWEIINSPNFRLCNNDSGGL